MWRRIVGQWWLIWMWVFLGGSRVPDVFAGGTRSRRIEAVVMVVLAVVAGVYQWRLKRRAQQSLDANKRQWGSSATSA
jgi:uncharacterized membrane protein